MNRAPLVLLFAIRALSQPACVIEGRATDRLTHQPLARTKVFARRDSAEPLVRSVTNDRGEFCFAALETGVYRITAQHAGYLDFIEPTPMRVGSDDRVPALSFEMTPAAVISGVVLNREGDPVPGAEVALYKEREKGHGVDGEFETTNANTDGTFRFTNLPAGTYYVQAAPPDEDGRPAAHNLDATGQPLRERDAATFYSGSATVDGATPITAEAGGAAQGVAITLLRARLRHLSGRIPQGLESPFLSVTGDAHRGWIALNPDGTFSEDLPAGQYSLTLSSMGTAVAEVDIDLTANDVAGLALETRRAAAATVPVTFRTEGGAPFQCLPNNLMLLREQQATHLYVGRFASDGAARFEDVSPGMYEFEIHLDSEPVYLKQPRPHEVLDLRGSSPGPIQVVLSRSVAGIEGRVKAAREIHDVTAIMVEDATAEPELVKAVTADQTGRFQMESLAPGKYRLFAIQAFDRKDWDPRLVAALAERSVAIELKENDRRKVELPLISSAELAAAVAKTTR